MRMCWKRILLGFAVVALALCGQPALSADKDKDRDKEQYVPDEGAFELILLRHHAVREDLHLGDTQWKQIREFASKQWKRAHELAERPEKDRRETFESMAKENRKHLKETLKPDQYRRLHQIAMQVAGLLMVTQPEVAEELKLTPEQKKKAEQLQEEARREFRKEIHSGATEGREKQMEEMRHVNHKRLMSILTESQREEWKRMAGKKFTADLSKD